MGHPYRPHGRPPTRLNADHAVLENEAFPRRDLRLALRQGVIDRLQSTEVDIRRRLAAAHARIVAQYPMRGGDETDQRRRGGRLRLHVEVVPRAARRQRDLHRAAVGIPRRLQSLRQLRDAGQGPALGEVDALLHGLLGLELRARDGQLRPGVERVAVGGPRHAHHLRLDRPREGRPAVLLEHDAGAFGVQVFGVDQETIHVE